MNRVHKIAGRQPHLAATARGGADMIRWSSGPKERGCIYHQRGVVRMASDSLVADVFVMPRIVARRPIAITIGRYREYKPVAKAEWQLRDVTEAQTAAGKFTSMFVEVGAPQGVASKLGLEVQDLVLREAPALTKALAELSRADRDSAWASDDEIPF